jgi:hypothetical protein
MVFQISQKEIEGVLKAAPEKRYKNFMRDVAGWENVWVIRNNKEEWITTKDEEGQIYIPLWPAKEYAEMQIRRIDEWKEFTAEPIEVHDFIDSVMHELEKHECEFEIFPISDNRGIFVNADILKEDIQEQLDMIE